MGRIIELAGLAILAAALGCATAGTLNPETRLDAIAAIAAAEETGAEDLAPEPLHSAREKLAEAENAEANGMPTRAGRLAEEARVDALLARALSEKARADQELAEARRLDAEVRRDTQEELNR